MKNSISMIKNVSVPDYKNITILFKQISNFVQNHSLLMPYYFSSNCLAPDKVFLSIKIIDILLSLQFYFLSVKNSYLSH